MPPRTYYAHTLEGYPETAWQTLPNHLHETASLAAQFASAFQSEEWAWLAGLWHDMGKYQDAFQARLRGEAVSVDHASIGAVNAAQSGPSALSLAFLIAGHHAGLANWVERTGSGPTPLKERLSKCKAAYDKCRQSIPKELADQEIPNLPDFLQAEASSNPKAAQRHTSYWMRMLFSALVDADYLDTERFMQPQRFEDRGGWDSIETLWTALDTYLKEFTRGLAEEVRNTPVNLARSTLLSDCLERASLPPGLFSLPAPTGSGKTLSSMAFALCHAVKHGLERVIVVLPYTSIIEQNAEVYRDVLGPANVLEHHASLTPERRRETLGDELTTQHQRAEENWDAPVIVTTTVQFFESLHANRPSRCRKLHRLARSVIILDEVQALPPGLLLPILDSMNELLNHYGCSIVLSTATPPALTRRESLPLGLPEPASIPAKPEEHFQTLARVHYQWPQPEEQALDWHELASQLSRYKQVLTVVDRRAHAYELAKTLLEQTGEQPFHLSTLMCPAHRLALIERIRERLKNGEPCRVVSTQLIEAGVDLDFPVVYRALAGLDHIVQAAGRCNREGRLERGEVIVFRPPQEPPPGTLRRGMHVTESMLKESEGSLDPDTPEVFERYFRHFYGQPQDERNILREAQSFNFANIAAQFKLIDDTNQMSIVCPYEGGSEAVEAFRTAQEQDRLSREEFRGLQAYLVQVYIPQLESLAESGAVLELSDRLFELAPGQLSRYDPIYGLILAGDFQTDPAELITA